MANWRSNIPLRNRILVFWLLTWFHLELFFGLVHWNVKSTHLPHIYWTSTIVTDILPGFQQQQKWTQDISCLWQIYILTKQEYKSLNYKAEWGKSLRERLTARSDTTSIWINQAWLYGGTTLRWTLKDGRESHRWSLEMKRAFSKQICAAGTTGSYFH